jgi:cytochrome c-type biogenesis protein CcmF
VFIGYAAMCVPAAFAVAGLISGNIREWVKVTLSWAVFGWITLGAGIIVGAYWAYEVLGWGGYWGWDPVENASLIPWLTGTALLHGMIAERARGTFRRTNVGLALVTFLFVFYATFLTRSNALEGQSVHTFGDALIGKPILLFMGLVLAFFVAILAARWKKIGGIPSFTSLASKDYVFFLAIVMFVLIAVVVLVGTSLPIAGKMSSGLHAYIVSVHKEGHVATPFERAVAGVVGATGLDRIKTASVDAVFYKKIGTPIALVLLALMAFAPVVPWKRNGGSEAQQGTGVIIAAVLIGVPFIAPRLNISAGAAAVFMIAVAVASLAGLVTNALTLGRTSKHGVRLVGSYLAHVGMGMMFVGVITSAFGGNTRTLVLPEGGKSVDQFGYRLSYEGVKTFGENKAGLKIKVQRGRKVVHAMPIMQLTRDQQMLASPYIVKTFGRDLYIAPKSTPGDEQKQLSRGQTVDVQDFSVHFSKFIVPNGHGAGDVRIGAELNIKRAGKTEKVVPFLAATQEHKSSGVAVPVPGMGAKIGIVSIRVEDKAVDITLTTDGGEPQAGTLVRGSASKIGDYTLLFKEWHFPSGDHSEHMEVGATIDVTYGGKTVTVQPVFSPNGGSEGGIVSEPAAIPGADMSVALTDVDVNTGEVLLTFTPSVPSAVVDVSVKPLISLIWIGSILALLGGTIAMWRRSVEAGSKVTDSAEQETE